jgi:gliding motility-associated-like protein
VNVKTIIQSVCALVCIAVSNTAYTQPPPTAAFSADNTKGCAPLIVQFSDASTGNASFWKWDFGNGTTSSQQNPGVIYTEPGIYTVILVAGNAQGTDSAIRTGYIEVYGKPEVEFTASPLSGCLPMQVQFTNQSNPVSGTITGYIWDFGDGQISPEINPKHTYTTENNFNISLTVQNSFGCKQSLQKNAFIKTTGKVTAAFAYTYANACQSPSVLQFTNQSTGSAAFTYKWSFGDGDTSSQASPQHTYVAVGTYAAQLIIFSDNGCSDTLNQNIAIGNMRPDFTLNSSTCTNKALDFTNTSTPAPLSASWSFGDGGSAATLHASHVYTAAGTYQVKMRANFGNCTDSITKSITISSKPITSFTTAGPADACAIPATVTFNNTTTGATSYKWLLGDGGSDNSQQPSHTYQAQGYYNVTLISFNANGCSDTVVKNKLVHIGPARVTGISGLPYAGCVPATLSMTTLTDGSQTITSWLWDLGDGTTSTEANPTHAYTNAGTYAVSVIIKTSSGCTDTFTLQQAVTLSPKPVADFSALPLSVCGSRPITFTDASTDATTWFWNFGDNSTSTLQDPKHGYKDTGYYTITLIVSNNFCSDTLRKGKYIHVDAPIAKFATAQQCSQPYVRTFTDQSIGAISWAWDFGDGQTDIARSPVHTYSTPGRYVVQLVVTNGSCTDSARTTITIADDHPSFTYTPVPPYCRKQNIQFRATDYTAAYTSSFNWNYGDGTSSGFGANATSTHAYAKAGSYVVTLSIKDVNGCTVTAQQTATFEVFGPTAAFTNPVGTCLKNDGSITFTDQTAPDGTNALTQWRWSFGDGQTADFTAAPFTHTYTRAGTYAVKLVVTDASGCRDSLTKNQAVTIADPKANFTLSDTVRCAANNVSFTNTSQGLTLTYRWYFGDGLQSTQASPTHSYVNQGQYNVALAVTDRLGCTDSIYKPAVLTISNPVASFNLLDTFVNCPPLIARPQNTSQSASSAFWDFGDGTTSVLPNAQHAYTQGGIFQLTLVAKGYGNCADTARKKVTILGPSGTIQFTPLFSCNPAPVAFRATTKNTQTIVWDFSDGTLLTTKDSLVTHTYANYGKYNPRLILTDSFNCRVSVSARDTLTVADVIAALRATQQTGCDSSLIAFTDLSQVYNDKITRYNWNFGDNGAGNTATTANPLHTYKRDGTYQVRLTVTTEKGCSKTMVQPLPVRVYSSPRLVLNVPDSACFNSPVRFEVSDNSSDTVINYWQWQYGNGQTAGTQNNTYTYPDAGVYPVQLIARNAHGCADTVTHTTTILALPRVDAGPDTSICLGSPLTLRPSGADKYTWRPAGSLSCTSCTNPVASPATGTRYYVTGSSNFGCIANDSLFVDVKQPPRLAGYVNDSLCAGESVQLSVRGAETYEWLPGTGLSNAFIPNPIAAPTVTTTYQVVGADTKKCFSEKANVTITVFPIPVFRILNDSVRTINVGFNDTLRTSSSPDINRWVWAPGNFLSCSNCPEPITNAKKDIVYIARVYNAGGCTSTDQVTVHVLCNGVNIYMPNTFSPNNDGMNDQFYPRGRGLTSIKSLRIFNRWGQPVYERLNFTANSAAEGWDGNFGGKPSSADVYVYIMEVVCENNTIVSYKGNVALLR